MNGPTLPSEVLHVRRDQFDGCLALLGAHGEVEEGDDAVDVGGVVGQ